MASNTQSDAPISAAERTSLRRDADTHMVIGGRRWRRTDPAIDEALRQALVDELMAARRAVKSGRRAGEDDLVEAARRRVDDAKVALGERGPTWWEEMSDDNVATRLAACRRALTASDADISNDDLPELLAVSESSRRARG